MNSKGIHKQSTGPVEHIQTEWGQTYLRVRVSAKSKWGQIPIVPIYSAWPETGRLSTLVIAVPLTCQNTMELNSLKF